MDNIYKYTYTVPVSSEKYFGYEGIAQLLLEQKKLMDALEAENRELRRRNLPIIDTLPHRVEPASTGFEGVAQLLLEQKLLMDSLEAENRELRRIKGMQSLPSLSTPSSPLVPQNSGQRLHKDESSSTAELAMKIFICYAREDEKLRQQLEKRLKGLRRQGLITIWHDRRISPGDEWEREIDAHLNEAQVILLLVSPDFIDSDYCYGIEMKRAIEKHNRKETTVIPIILRYVHWEWTPFGKLQALPKDAKPVCSWPDSDEAFFNVTDGIRIVVEEEAHRIREGRDR